MMRTLRALISSMLRSIVALLQAPATRGIALRRLQHRGARRRARRASTKPVDDVAVAEQRGSARARSM